MLIDSHAHLNDGRLLAEAETIHADMEGDGLLAVVNVGYDVQSSEKSVELSEKYEKIFGAVGIHPHDAVKADGRTYSYFEEAIRREKVVALGEIGLDFFYDLSPREVQERVFLEQLELAHSSKIPAIIHLRDAYALMLKLLKENKRLLEYGAVLHCYCGSKEMLQEYAKLDLYFSFGGAITFKNAVDKPDIVRACPKDRLMLETDCPYMTPVPYRGKVNYPKYVGLVAEKAAEILGLPLEELHSLTVKNTLDFFPKLKKAFAKTR